MTKKAIQTALAFVTLMVFASGLAFAKTKQINISYEAKLADGPELEPGSYKIDVDTAQSTPEVIFYKGNEVVAKAEAKLVEQPHKTRQTEVLYNMGKKGRVITEVRPSGWKNKLVFEGQQQGTASTP